MTWTDTDDAELQESLDRLYAKQKELQEQLSPLDIIINNSKQIQSRELTTFNEARERQITKISPKDKWGVDMTDDARLAIKEECISKTIELLGEPDE